MERRATGRRGKWVLFALLFALGLAGAAGAFARWPMWCFSTLTRGRLAWSGIRGHTLALDGMDIHYLEGGAGRPVVFVHGLAGQAQDWATLLPDVVRAGFHVYAMDLPGFGDSDKPPMRSYSIPEQARFVEAFLDAVHLGPVTLVGVSMGGWVAATVALDAPQRVERLVLVDSAGFAFKPGFNTALFTPTTPKDVDALLALLMPRPEPLPGFVKEDVVRQGEGRAWVVHRALASMADGADVLDTRFSQLKMPLLLVWGKQDMVTPLGLGEAMHHATPQSILEVYDGCGHLAFATCAERISPQLVRFLRGSGPPAGETLQVAAQ
jgi:pimeloyl-ACP methyl ester carboxylesterase